MCFLWDIHSHRFLQGFQLRARILKNSGKLSISISNVYVHCWVLGDWKNICGPTWEETMHLLKTIKMVAFELNIMFLCYARLSLSSTPSRLVSKRTKANFPFFGVSFYEIPVCYKLTFLFHALDKCKFCFWENALV